MGCKTRDLFDQPTVSSSSSSTVRDALLFTTMCIIGLPVEVQVTDGSIYSGICHTACFDKDYGIILKKAKMTKNGKEVVVDTLVVSSCDLVQVVAKGILLPSEGIVRDVPSENVGAMNGSFQSFESLENELQTSTQCKTVPEHFVKGAKHIRQSRSSSQNENKSVIGLENKNVGNNLLSNFENGRLKEDFVEESLGSIVEIENRKVDITPSAKIDEATTVPVGLVAEGQVGKDQSQVKKYDHNHECGSRTDVTRHGVQLSNPGANANLPSVQSLSSVQVDVLKTSSKEPSCGNPVHSLVRPSAQDFERPASASPSMDVQSPFIKSVNMSSQLSTSQSVSQTPSIAPKDSVSNRSSKEFKLNAGAKTFMPMFSNTKPATPAPIAAASMDFIPNNPPAVPVAVAPPENARSPFASLSALPTKFVPYNNLVAINGDNASQYSQPIVGHVGSRLQSVRYTGQYNPVQAGPTYIPPSSQAVMVGRLGQQLVYMHPVSHDLMQGSIAPIPVSVRPQLTPQLLLPKQQGISTAPALQVCATQPPFVVSGQQPYAMASNIPFSQPAFPTVRPIFVPSASGHFSTKFL